MRVLRIASAGVMVALAAALAGASVAQPSKPGLSIDSVRAFPVAAQPGHSASRGLLRLGKVNTVAATSALAFRVVVHNGSAAPRTGVQVVLQISRPAPRGGPIVHQVPLGPIESHGTSGVTFTDIGQIPFAARTSLTVSVPGQVKQYPVIFSLPSGNYATPVSPAAPFRNPPNVVGLDQDEAIQTLEAAGFSVLLEPVYSKKPAGRVLGFRTGSGVQLAQPGGQPSRQIVELMVSNGKKPG